MTGNLALPLPQDQPENFEETNRAKNFKRLLNLDLLLSNRPRKAIADGMGVSESSLSRWLSESVRDNMPGYWQAAWNREVGLGTFRWTAKESGLVLTRDDYEQPEPVEDGAQLISLISKHHGNVMALIIQAREDGVIDDTERATVYPEIKRLIREIEAEAEYFRPRPARPL